MLVAMSCSTYYSYIGIYNSVNSPARFLQERYVQIAEELTGRYDAGLEENIGMVREAVNDAASQVTVRYTLLSKERENLEACRVALSEEGDSYAEGMRAPRQAAYENYEDYVAAYNAYIAGISAGSNTEEQAGRAGVLSSYGFASIEELQEAEAENAAALSALNAALGVTDVQAVSTEDNTSSVDSPAILDAISDISVNLSLAIDEAMMGQEFDSEDSARLNRLLQAARLCDYELLSVADIMNIVNRAAEITKEPLLAEYAELVSALEEGRVTDANTMELKSAMDSEILTALLKLNSLLPSGEQISLSDSEYVITDLYLIPVQALRDPTTKMTALFCLGVAALIDMLSVLFAISLRKRKPLWKRHTLVFCNQEDYAPQIYASLPAMMKPDQAFAEFLSRFVPSPETECDGYMMRANMKDLNGYYPLVALLCQINLAKLVPEGLLTEEASEDEEMLLLKARFVFWANSMIYEEKVVCHE